MRKWRASRKNLSEEFGWKSIRKDYTENSFFGVLYKRIQKCKVSLRQPAALVKSKNLIVLHRQHNFLEHGVMSQHLFSNITRSPKRGNDFSVFILPLLSQNANAYSSYLEIILQKRQHKKTSICSTVLFYTVTKTPNHALIRENLFILEEIKNKEEDEKL